MNEREQQPAVKERTELTTHGEVATRPSSLAAANQSSDFGSRSSNYLQRSVDLHIEELVLDGFAPGDRYLIGDAVERELTRLLNEQGVPADMIGDREDASLNMGTINLQRGANPQAVGIELAKAIYGGFNR